MYEDSYLDQMYEDRFETDYDYDDVDYYDDEPDLDSTFEHDSAMESVGWGDSDLYGCDIDNEIHGGEW